MPYIKKDNRSDLNEIADKAMPLLGGDSPFFERLTYFCYHIVCSLSPFSENVNPETYSLKYDDRFEEIQALANEAVELIYSRGSVYETFAGDFNYLISRITWGLIGAAPGVPLARYGIRSLIKGSILSVLTKLERHSEDFDDPFVIGAITDIVDEMYRRKTAAFEDQKCLENGDVW